MMKMSNSKVPPSGNVFKKQEEQTAKRAPIHRAFNPDENLVVGRQVATLQKNGFAVDFS